MKKYDRNKNGVLDKEEFKSLINDIGYNYDEDKFD